ncbi:glutathione S-transferase family protein [Mesorhizobium sp. CO1-1-8]|uniref:glutathione S-transferase family protein n=1 Tax=Mesorhizobium sp. CO1-1-8 TaxID=2876631 RepID=UPI001CD12CB8|nr:glutathione S-transferase family protein [Mesorhizobium sp. CO1-1-8]MBZ9772450.1 glutathione S-transferase family protein [Mesorhizobium sp. CO1-1-8]
MTILLYDLVGHDAARPFSPHCWKVTMALAHKGLDKSSVPTRFLEVPQVEGGSRRVPVIKDGEKVVVDSFSIGLYLDEAYPDRPRLFGADGGVGIARFFELWADETFFPYITTVAAMDLLAMQDPENAAYFRRSRERSLGKRLEDVISARDEGLSSFRASLQPLRSLLACQPFIGGQSPLFVDYIVFGALQWARISSSYRLLEDSDVVAQWFERCLDLHNGLGRTVAAAA